MPTERIGDANDVPVCRDPEHLPPRHQVFEPGRYVHTCPSCGMETPFTIHEHPW
jgi:hypothetical protein